MEVTKFWTKTKLIILISVIAIIGIIVGIVMFNRSKARNEYIKMESKINSNAYYYFLLEYLSLDVNEYKKINIGKLAKHNLIPKKFLNKCSGYVIAENNLSEDADNLPQLYDYSTYLKCKSVYTTPGYGEEITSKKENKTKSQSEEDTIAPVITLLDSKTITISIGDEFEDPGATAEDNVDGDLSDKIKVSGEVDTSKEGTYTLKYTVKDKAGNKATKTRKVIVKAEKVTNNTKGDKVAPVITFKNTTIYQKVCIGDKVDVTKNGLYGYSAHDNKDGDITKNVKITGPKGTVTEAGEFTLTYTVSDKAGNEAQVSRKYSGVDCSTPTTPTTPSTPTTTPSTGGGSSSGGSSSSGSSSSSSGGSSSGGSTSTTPSTPTTTPSTGGGSSSGGSSSSGGGSSSSGSTNINIPATGISCQDTVYVTVGGTQNLNASVLPANATNKKLNYVSSNLAIARVDTSGNVTGVQRGETRITISTANGRTKAVIVVVE